VTVGALELATRDMHAATEGARRVAAPRLRLRALVGRVDVAIGACERAHLAGRKRVTPELLEHAVDVYREAREAMPLARVVHRAPQRIDHLMESLWAVQALVFELLQPVVAGGDDRVVEGSRPGSQVVRTAPL
jgi:hypothetical protein